MDINLLPVNIHYVCERCVLLECDTGIPNGTWEDFTLQPQETFRRRASLVKDLHFAAQCSNTAEVAFAPGTFCINLFKSAYSAEKVQLNVTN